MRFRGQRSLWVRSLAHSLARWPAAAAVQRSQAAGCRLISNSTIKQQAGLKSALINPAYRVSLDFDLLRLCLRLSPLSSRLYKVCMKDVWNKHGSMELFFSYVSCVQLRAPAGGSRERKQVIGCGRAGRPASTERQHSTTWTTRRHQTDVKAAGGAQSSTTRLLRPFQPQIPQTAAGGHTDDVNATTSCC